MLLSPNTYKELSSFATYCRTGDFSFTGKVDKERVSHYRRLVINVVRDSLNAAYPLTRNLVEQEEWDSLVEQFFTYYACQSSQIWKMPQELYTYITEVNHQLLKKYYVLKELLLFEWLEIQLYMQEDIETDCVLEGSLSVDKLVLNPEYILKGFCYPVHLKKAKKININDVGQYFVMLHRHPNSGKVLFTNLSPAFVRVIELLNESVYNIDELSVKVAVEFFIENISSVKEHIHGFLKSAYKNKLILGFEIK